MNIIFHRDFRKRYEKLRHREQMSVDERIRLFAVNHLNPLLNNHAPQGEYEGCRSINITGDLRAIYREVGFDAIFFIAIGTHTALYE